MKICVHKNKVLHTQNKTSKNKGSGMNINHLINSNIHGAHSIKTIHGSGLSGGNITKLKDLLQKTTISKKKISL